VTKTAATRNLLIGLAILSLSLGAFAQTEGEDKYRKAGSLVDDAQFVRALAIYQEILNAEPSPDPKTKSRILNNMGFCHYKLQNTEKAEEFYRQAIDIDPDYATCLNNLAALLMNRGKHEEALPYLNRAHGLEKNIKVVFNLFVCHYYLKHEREARAFIEEAFALDDAYTSDRLKSKNISPKDVERLRKEIKSRHLS
jgi:Tfp pilus assembly protein PilF